MPWQITALIHGALTIVGLGSIGFIGAEYWYDLMGGIQQVGDIDLTEIGE